MLLVARRVGEALRIGTDIEVKIVASSRSRVLLAVSAPRELDIRRIYGKSDNKPQSPSLSAEGDEEAIVGEITAGEITMVEITTEEVPAQEPDPQAGAAAATPVDKPDVVRG